jgi:hypothetical protein
MDERLLTAAFVAALFTVGLVAAAAPRRLLWATSSWLTLGMTERTRARIARAAGLVVLLLSLWFAWRLFAVAA